MPETVLYQRAREVKPVPMGFSLDPYGNVIMIKIASVQHRVVFGDPMANAERLVETLNALASEGVRLAVFPEAYLTGYCVASCDHASQIAIDLTEDSSALSLVANAVEDTGIVVIVGLAAEQGGHLYNAALLFEPGAPARRYFKAHLPELGFDKYVERGDELPVFDTRLGRIGVLICFDIRPPEAARVLALKGADIIAIPTNWPEGAEISADVFAISRAAENRVFVITANRVGTENGFRFIGRSKIVAPTGQVLAEAGSDEAVIVAEVDLGLARQKRIVTRPGQHEITVFESRRPDLYGELVKPILPKPSS